jgi:hypothetical protein
LRRECGLLVRASPHPHPAPKPRRRPPSPRDCGLENIVWMFERPNRRRGPAGRNDQPSPGGAAGGSPSGKTLPSSPPAHVDWLPFADRTFCRLAAKDDHISNRYQTPRSRAQPGSITSAHPARPGPLDPSRERGLTSRRADQTSGVSPEPNPYFAGTSPARLAAPSLAGRSGGTTRSALVAGRPLDRRC